MAGPIRHVILPWTQPTLIRDTSQQPYLQDLQRDLSIKVSESAHSTALQDAPRKATHLRESAPHSDNPWLDFMQLKPLEIPEEHREVLDEQSLIGATIVLDVFTTQSPQINERETILAEVAQLLLDTTAGVTGDHSELESVADILAEPEGTLRQELGERLQEAAIANNDQAIPGPVSVTNAIRAIEAMSDVAIREATLIIDGQPLVEIKPV